MKNWKIGKKLAVSFIILIGLAAFGNFYAISNLNKAGQLNQELFEGPYQLTSQSMGVRRDLVTIARNIGRSIIEKDEVEARKHALDAFDSLDQRINVITKSLGGETDLTREFKESIKNYKSSCEEVFTAISKGEYDRASEITDVNTTYMNSYDRASEIANELYKNAETRGKEFNSEVIKTVSTSKIVATVVSISTMALGVIICIFITKSLLKPIKDLEKASNKMAKGDFDIDLDYESEDELGNLSNTISEMGQEIKSIINDTVYVLGEVASGNFMVEPSAQYIGIFKNIEKSLDKITHDLSETMTQINLAADEVEGASEQVSSGAQMLSQGATEQAGSIQELTATISDIAQKVQYTAENAQKANDLTLSSAKQVSDGNDQMKQMVQAMEEISFTSSEIGRIIKTIDDIAFQTNILSLNAAVEAARAGSAGKGFAVVADEVRNLAAKSAEAAKNTAALIENSIKAVENGTEIVDNTAKSLEKIIDTTNQTNQLVNEIAIASETQATAINQVSLGVEQVSSVVQTNSATAEESAASSEELSGQAQMLKSLIESFVLKNTDAYSKKFSFSDDGDDNFSMSEY